MSENNSSVTNNEFSSAELMDRSGFGLYQAALIFLCMMINMFDGFDITAMAVVAAEVGAEMQVQEDKLGFVFSFSLAGMMLGAMFLASLSDIYGRRTLIIASLVVVGISVILTSYAQNLTQLVILRFISGLGAGAMLASLATLVSEYSPTKYRALAVSIVTAGYPLGAMFTGIVAGDIVPEYGWRGIFLFGGVATIGLCCVVVLFLPESLPFLCKKRPRNALAKINRILKRFSAESISKLPSIDSQLAVENKSVIGNIRLLLAKDYRVKTITLWLCFLLVVCTLYFLLSWLPKLLINEGFSSQFSRQAFTWFNLGGVLGVFSLGIFAARWSLSLLVMLFLFVSASLMFAYSVVGIDQTLILAMVFAIGLTLQGGFTGLYALGAKFYPSEIRSTGVGCAIGVGRLGAVFGPAIAGVLIAAGVSMGANFSLFALPLIVGGLGIYSLKVR